MRRGCRCVFRVYICELNYTKMREIKFRAKKDDMSNCSFQHGQLTYDLNGCPRIHFADGKNTSCLKGTEGQFTGLKDKNGREIYEGDLLHRHLHVYWQVKLKDSKWIADELKPMSGLYLDASQFIGSEVIGNIHENPELL